MGANLFGSLREWGDVPGKLTRLVEGRQLDEHEDELIRLLRYGQNWRLRDLALSALKNHPTPSAQILTSVLAVLADEGVYYETRILAAESLGQLVQSWQRRANGELQSVSLEIATRLETLLETSHEPILDAAILNCLLQVRRKARTPSSSV